MKTTRTQTPEMLEYTQGGSGACFELLVHHTDSKREWAYDRQSHIGTLDRGLDGCGHAARLGNDPSCQRAVSIVVARPAARARVGDPLSPMGAYIY